MTRATPMFQAEHIVTANSGLSTSKFTWQKLRSQELSHAHVHAAGTLGAWPVGSMQESN